MRYQMLLEDADTVSGKLGQHVQQTHLVRFLRLGTASDPRTLLPFGRIMRS